MPPPKEGYPEAPMLASHKSGATKAKIALYLLSLTCEKDNTVSIPWLLSILPVHSSALLKISEQLVRDRKTA